MVENLTLAELHEANVDLPTPHSEQGRRRSQMSLGRRRSQMSIQSTLEVIPSSVLSDTSENDTVIAQPGIPADTPTTTQTLLPQADHPTTNTTSVPNPDETNGTTFTYTVTLEPSNTYPPSKALHSPIAHAWVHRLMGPLLAILLYNIHPTIHRYRSPLRLPKFLFVILFLTIVSTSAMFGASRRRRTSPGYTQPKAYPNTHDPENFWHNIRAEQLRSQGTVQPKLIPQSPAPPMLIPGRLNSQGLIPPDSTCPQLPGMPVAAASQPLPPPLTTHPTPPPLSNTFQLPTLAS